MSGFLQLLSTLEYFILTHHVRGNIFHKKLRIFCYVQVANKSTTALSPSIVETYSRLLVYSEIESLGIKGFLNQLLPKVFVQQSWGTLHTLLEIFSYRLYHIQVGR